MKTKAKTEVEVEAEVEVVVSVRIRIWKHWKERKLLVLGLMLYGAIGSIANVTTADVGVRNDGAEKIFLLSESSQRQRDLLVGGASVRLLDGLWNLSLKPDERCDLVYSSEFHQDEYTNLPVNVPGDLITDLYELGLLPPPLFEMNFKKNTSLWSQCTWVYSKNVILSGEQRLSIGDYVLVFDGIKMGARVYVNGKMCLTARDQFLRYLIPLRVEGDERQESIKIEVEFDPTIDTFGRFAAFSGGWDWAPYTRVTTPGSEDLNGNRLQVPAYSRGLWKSVALVEPVRRADGDRLAYFVEAVVVKTSYRRADGRFLLQVALYIRFPVCEKRKGDFAFLNDQIVLNLTLQGDWNPALQTYRTQTVTASQVVRQRCTALIQGKMNIPATSVQLWRPACQVFCPCQSSVLYTLQIRLNELQLTRRVGFRSLALRTDSLKGQRSVEQNGTGDFGMILEVNDEPVYLKGANLVPIDLFEGNYNREIAYNILLAAKEAGMNMIRVWGGGVFLPDYVYDSCDELGLLVLHDLMVVQPGHDFQSQEGIISDLLCEEAKTNAARLSHHPSIVMYAGCNECNVSVRAVRRQLSFLFSCLAEVDDSRIIWPSSPSSGWSSGVARDTGLPNGLPLRVKVLSLSTQPEQLIEQHGPYVHGSGFSSVNGFALLQEVSTDLPVRFDQRSLFHLPVNDQGQGLINGLEHRNFFVTEFGCVVGSSSEALSAQLQQDHLSLSGNEEPDACLHVPQSNENICNGSNPLSERNYPCHNIIETYFGAVVVSSAEAEVGRTVLEKQLYMCSIGQLLKLKGLVERLRSQNSFGQLVWQLNDVWATFGWGSLEYVDNFAQSQLRVSSKATRVKVAPRWKPVHYWLRWLFSDVFATCGYSTESNIDRNTVLCYVKNDAPVSIQVSIKSDLIQLQTSEVVESELRDMSLPSGPGMFKSFSLTFLGLDSCLSSSRCNFALRLFLTFHPLQNGPVQQCAEHLTNWVFFAAPKHLLLPKPSKIRYSIAGLTAESPAWTTDGIRSQVSCAKEHRIYINVDTNRFAAFVLLTTEAQGRFSDNAFMLMKQEKRELWFEVPHGVSCLEEYLILKSSLRLEHVADYV